MATTQPREQLVDFLVKARLRENVSLVRIGVRAGMTGQAIWMAEQRHSSFSVPMLEAYAELCGLDRTRLLLSWGHVPEEDVRKLQERPELLELIRAA